MALELSAKAALYAQGTNVSQQIILEIDGIDLVFGAVEVLKVAKIGDDDLDIDGTWLIGGNYPNPKQRDYISLNKTSKNITQQLRQDKGATSSVSKVKIELLDKDNYLTQLFAPGYAIDDILSARAKVYLNFAQGAHPEDSIEIFSGIIDDVQFPSGTVILSIAHPEQLKRQEIFQQVTTQLNGAIDSSQTTITVDSTENFITPNADTSVKTYIRIEDEIIEYTGLTATTLTGCVRGQLNTIAAEHDDDTETITYYRLIGEAIDLALKLMISGCGTFGESTSVYRFVKQEDNSLIDNTIAFTGINVKQKFGLSEGDFVTVTGATNAANNVSAREILSIEQTDNGSYIVVDGTALVEEIDTSAVCSFTSQYDTLPTGCGLSLTPDQVDVDGHNDLNLVYGSSYHSYDFYLNDTINGKTFIEEEIYFPSGLYSIPRKGRASVGSTNPPLAGSDTKKIGLSEVIAPDKIQIGRSINGNFYNAIVYKYDKDSIEDKYLKGTITLNETSTNRIKVGSRPMTIKSSGIRSDGAANINIQSRKFLDRYKFAAESLTFNVMYDTGLDIEVGDIVIFGDADMKMTDIKTGTRDFAPRLMEVTNKNFNLSTGQIKLQITDTAFDIGSRFVSISPASKLDSGCTTTSLKLKKEFTIKGLERAKWEQYIGENLVVRNNDFSFNESTTITSFDSVDNTKVTISPALSTAPSEDYILEVPAYTGDSDTNKFVKQLHGSLTPQVNITSGTSDTEFVVDSATNLFVGAKLYVHNSDFSVLSEEVEISDITGLNITVSESLGFTPASGYFVEGVGFISDEGDAYLIT